MPSLPADSDKNVGSAAAKIPDERASHFWDEKGTMKIAYQKLMKMDEPAWDVYYVYGKDAEWTSELPPEPVYWMHQLANLPKERMLNGDTLAQEMTKLLQENKAEK